VEAAVGGRTLTGARRIGKLLLLDLDGGDTVLGLRFGMTGRLLMDGDLAIDRLEYSSRRLEPAWDRFTVHFDGGGSRGSRIRAGSGAPSSIPTSRPWASTPVRSPPPSCVPSWGPARPR
jgi:hypothetical protein